MENHAQLTPNPAPPGVVIFNRTYSTEIVDLDIVGAEPIPSLLGPGQLMEVRRGRVTILNGVVDMVWVYGPRISTTGRTLKTQHGRAVHTDDINSPAWVMDLVAAATSKENLK